MSNEENKYSFDLCKRRGIKTTLHPIVTDPKLLKDMTRKHVAAQNKGSRKTRKEDIQQPAPYHLQIYTYEQLLQHYRNFFMTGPLMRCLDGDKNMDKKSENELLLRLQEDVRKMPSSKPSKPSIQMTANGYRGELHIRAFWDNVRLQLQPDEEDDDIDESKSKAPFEDSTDKGVADHVKARAQGLRSLKLVTKVYGRRSMARSNRCGKSSSPSL